MKKIIRKIIREDRREMYLDKIVQVMKNDYPIFKNMELYGFYDQLSEEELIYVLSGIFGVPVTLKQRYKKVYDKNGNNIYSEDSYGFWIKSEYDENNKIIYSENYDGYWEKFEYDENGNEIYYEDYNGFWTKSEYDKNVIYIYRTF